MRMPIVPRRLGAVPLAALAAGAILLAGCAAPAEVGAEQAAASQSAVIALTVAPTVSAPVTSTLSSSAATSAPSSSAVTRSTPSSSAPSSQTPSPTPVYGTKAKPIPVQVTGTVLADSKGKVVMCPPFPVAAIGTVSSEVQTPVCTRPVPIAGVDMAVVKDPDHNKTHRWGVTHVEATWNGTTLTVRSQRLPTDADRDPTDTLPEGVPCPAPAGGWTLGATQNDPGVDKVEAAVGPDFGAQAMGYPHGGPTNDDGTNPSYSLDHTEQVLVVGTTGDLQQATAAIRKVFEGNLCVVRATTTGAEIKQQSQRILAALGTDWESLGVIGVGEPMAVLGTTTNQIDVIVDTPELEKLRAGIPGPPIAINPWIKPER